MKTIVLIRQEIDIEGEVENYSQLPNAKDYKDKQYKVYENEDDTKYVGIYYSNGKFWCLRPDIYFNDDLKESK